ncbi:hypothetical protein VTJ83DRAFT_3965 [Remersonia thermophila]|uniref:Uncharacterized protein n=1 Tax=Remersonia thermophila TaxID=72144 RepID=A0ABR4DGE7_9PEZI
MTTMDLEASDPNLLLLSLNLSDSEPDEAAAPATAASGSASLTRAERTALSEEAFQELKRTYRPKVENGDLYQSVPLPLHYNTHNPESASASAAGASSSSTTATTTTTTTTATPLTKPEAQALLHAVEELYFFKRYEAAVEFLRGVLGQEEGEDGLESGPKKDTNEGPGAGGGKRDRGASGNGDGDGVQDDRERATGKKEPSSTIDAETRRLLRYYLRRCLARAREAPDGPQREVSCC